MNRRRFERLKTVLARRQPDLTVLMEQVNKPHNLAAILRNCDAVGILEAHAVLPEKEIQVSNHASAGTGKWVTVQTHAEIGEAVSYLKRNDFRVLAAHPCAEAVDFRQVDFTGPVALMVGAELEGISDEGLAMADERISVPMLGMARSLNVSVATALVLFEAQRQRRNAGLYDRSRLPPDRFDRILFEWCYPELALVLRKRKVAYPPLTPEGEPVMDPRILRD